MMLGARLADLESGDGLMGSGRFFLSLFLLRIAVTRKPLRLWTERRYGARVRWRVVAEVGQWVKVGSVGLGVEGGYGPGPP